MFIWRNLSGICLHPQASMKARHISLDSASTCCLFRGIYLTPVMFLERFPNYRLGNLIIFAVFLFFL